MSNLAKEISEAVTVVSNGTSTHGGGALEAAEAKEVNNKKTSVNQVIESCLNLPTIENDPAFSALWVSAPSDVVRNGLKAAWANMPHIKAAFSLSLDEIVTKCSVNSFFHQGFLAEASLLVNDYAKSFNCSLVVFKEVSKDAKDFAPITVNLKNGGTVAVNQVIEKVEDGKDTLNKKIAALASAYRLVIKANKGVKSLDDLKADAITSIYKVKNLMSKEDFAEWLDSLKG